MKKALLDFFLLYAMGSTGSCSSKKKRKITRQQKIGWVMRLPTTVYFTFSFCASWNYFLWEKEFLWVNKWLKRTFHRHRTLTRKQKYSSEQCIVSNASFKKQKLFIYWQQRLFGAVVDPPLCIESHRAEIIDINLVVKQFTWHIYRRFHSTIGH